jgi:hypothetical protein
MLVPSLGSSSSSTELPPSPLQIFSFGWTSAAQAVPPSHTTSCYWPSDIWIRRNAYAPVTLFKISTWLSPSNHSRMRHGRGFVVQVHG